MSGVARFTVFTIFFSVVALSGLIASSPAFAGDEFGKMDARACNEWGEAFSEKENDVSIREGLIKDKESAEYCRILEEKQGIAEEKTYYVRECLKTPEAVAQAVRDFTAARMVRDRCEDQL